MKRLESNFVLGFNQNFAKYHKKIAEYRKVFAAKRAKIAKNSQGSYDAAKIASSSAKLKAQTFVYESRIVRPAAIVALSFIFGLGVGKTFLPINRAEAAPLNIPEPSISIQNTTEEEKATPGKADIPAIASSAAGVTRYAATSATSSAPADLSIPSAGISTSVVGSSLSNNNLSVPTYGASKYNSLIMGHLYGVFSNLANTAPGQKIYLYGESYTIYSVEHNLPVSSDRKSVGNYSMGNLIYRGSDLTLMTCAGSYNNALGTYSHRTIVFAKKD